MSWVFIVILAHLCYAVVFVIDRYLLKKKFPNPVNYTFYIGVLSIFTLFLAFIDFSVPAIGQIILSFVAGFMWLLATLIFYTALFKGESSRVVPTVGGLIPIFTLFLSFIFLSERLIAQELIAFCFLVGGGILLSLLVSKTDSILDTKKIRFTKTFIPAIGAALAFAVYFTITKSLFLSQGFINGIIWVRLGIVLSSLLLLIPASFRKMIFQKTEQFKISSIKLFFFIRVLGVLAILFLYWAIFLGSVTLVNALQGVQYLFILLLAFLFFRKIPDLKEQFSKRVLIQKVAAIALICLGLAILVI